MMSYRLDSQDSISGRDKKLFSSSQHPDHPWGPSRFLYNRIWEGFSPYVKQVWLGADDPPPSKAEASNCGTIPLLPHILPFMA